MNLNSGLMLISITGGDLRTLIKSEYYLDIAWGIKLHAGNVGFENNILTLSSFAAFLLRRLLKEVANP